LDSFGQIEVCFAALAIITVVVYTLIGIRVAKTGGRVRVDKFGLADVIVCSLLMLYLITRSIAAFTSAEVEIHDSDLVASSIAELFVVTSLCSFIYFRGMGLSAQLGLGALRIDKVAGMAVALLLAWFPLMIFASLVIQHFFGQVDQQEVIRMFQDAAHQKNHRTVVYIFVTAAVIAPVAEELIFRGYIYPVLKRNFGIIAGLVINAGLFAAVHGNLAALPILFLLAICLTLAYEYTGSILVNICMHGLFNLIELSLILLLSTVSKP
jgi:membrane protease YdiL (CAAX protease family)